MFSCGCASPDCAVNGCALQRRLLQQTYFAPAPQPQFGYGAFTPAPLTADDIRFYTFHSDGEGAVKSAGWIEFSSYFIDGKLQSIVCTRNEPPTPTQEQPSAA